MKKITGITFLILGLLFGGVFYLYHKITNVIIHNINEFKNAEIFPDTFLTYESILKDNSCKINLCFIIKNTQITYHSDTLDVGTVFISFFPFFNKKVKIKNRIDNVSNNQIKFNTTVTPKEINIHQATLIFNQLNAKLNGYIDLQESQNTTITAEATHLKTTLMPYLPSHFRSITRFLLKNEKQTFHLENKNGWFLVNGFPILHETTIHSFPVFYK